MQTVTGNPVPTDGRPSKIERETKMTMKVSETHTAPKKNVYDVLVDIALRQMEKENSRQTKASESG